MAIDAKRLERMIEMRREGLTLAEISAIEGIPLGTIGAKLNGIRRPPCAHYEFVAELRKQGLSMNEIAGRIGRSRNRVWQILNHRR